MSLFHSLCKSIIERIWKFRSYQKAFFYEGGSTCSRQLLTRAPSGTGLTELHNRLHAFIKKNLLNVVFISAMIDVPSFDNHFVPRKYVFTIHKLV